MKETLDIKTIVEALLPAPNKRNVGALQKIADEIGRNPDVLAGLSADQIRAVIEIAPYLTLPDEFKPAIYNKYHVGTNYPGTEVYGIGILPANSPLDHIENRASEQHLISILIPNLDNGPLGRLTGITDLRIHGDPVTKNLQNSIDALRFRILKLT